jgi:hypothetical protein
MPRVVRTIAGWLWGVTTSTPAPCAVYAVAAARKP